MLGELWRRAVAVYPALDRSLAAVLGILAFVLVVFAWPLVRMLVTVFHEAGHAIVGTLAGRSLSGIKLHSDTSGLTVTRGKPRGLGMALTLWAGHPGASLAGLGAAVLAGSGRAAAVLWGLVVLLALMLAWVRNLFGAFVVLLLGVGVAVGSWYAPSEALSYAAGLLAWLLLLAGPRPVLEQRGRKRGSDADQLARLTRLPAPVWTGSWLLVTLACAVGGAACLLGLV